MRFPYDDDKAVTVGLVYLDSMMCPSSAPHRGENFLLRTTTISATSTNGN
jgi:hypothetical protein